MIVSEARAFGGVMWAAGWLPSAFMLSPPLWVLIAVYLPVQLGLSVVSRGRR